MPPILTTVWRQESQQSTERFEKIRCQFHVIHFEKHREAVNGGFVAVDHLCARFTTLDRMDLADDAIRKVWFLKERAASWVALLDKIVQGHQVDLPMQFRLSDEDILAETPTLGARYTGNKMDQTQVEIVVEALGKLAMFLQLVYVVHAMYK